MVLKPQDVARDLGISPSTLRLWSSRFADLLGDQARKLSADGTASTAQRRYTDADVAMFMQAKDLLAQGLTYDDVRQRLGAPPFQRAPRPEHRAGEYAALAQGLDFPPSPSAPDYEYPSQPRPTPAYAPQPRPDAAIPPRPRQFAAEPRPLVATMATSSPTGREALDPRDQTIATLNHSLSSMDSYLSSILDEVRDLRAKEKQLRREVEQIRLDLQAIAQQQRKRPWWKRLLADSEAPTPQPLARTRQRQRANSASG